jgi:septum formation protein
MADIILASRSKARAELLKQIGLDFEVSIPEVEESLDLISSPEDLVIANAVKKAEYTAKRFRSGIIIAADTVLFSLDRIIAKPSSIKEAALMLKDISQRPLLVYSGLALVDIVKDRMETGYEKTELSLRPLSDRDIEWYLRRVNPLDKAAGFDIQGLGAVFVERIDGCFYNVVGLPLFRLAKILKKIDSPII